MSSRKLAIAGLGASVLSLAAAFVVPTASVVRAQDAASKIEADKDREFAARLAAFEAALDHKRSELGVPGAAIVVVKDGKVVSLKGFGHRDLASKQPVTPDTLFPIASASKAFTSLAVMMMVDDGKLTLKDRPATFVPDFKISSAATNSAVSLLDLLTHRTGLPRSDAAWIVAQGLTRAELIRSIATLKPTAKLGAKWQYQNMMYVVAGEVAGAAAGNGVSFEDLVTQRIFKPLGMKQASFDHARFMAAADRVTGYESGDTQPAKLLDASIISAAGGIITSARDMGEWVKFMLAEGRVGDNRLIKPESFAELVRPQMKVGGDLSYGLGWMIQKIDGATVVEHGGDLPGIQTEVALLPAKGIGFALLTNSTANGLRDWAVPAARQYLASDAPLPAAAAPESPAAGQATDRREAGTYAFGGSDKDYVVSYKAGKLTLFVPGDQVYGLVPLGERRYRFENVDGFVATFRPATHDPAETELFLHLPQGDLVLAKRRRATLIDAEQPLAGLIGHYVDKQKLRVEIANIGGKLALIVPGQPAYPLVPGAKGAITLTGLRPGQLIPRQSGDAVTGFTLVAPSGRHEFTGPTLGKADITLAELGDLVIAAHGGRERIAGFKSMVATVEARVTGEGQGLLQKGTVSAKDGRFASVIVLSALGKPAGVLRSTASAAGASMRKDNEPVQALNGDMMTMLLTDAYLQEPLQWDTIYKKVTLLGVRRIDNRPVYAVSKVHHSGAQQVDSYDAESHLRVRRSFRVRNPDGSFIDIITRYSDYREVGGVMIPHRTSTNTQGQESREIAVYSEVAINTDVADDAFDITTDLP